MPPLHERYGRGSGRVPFASAWRLDSARPFVCEPDAACERLRCPPGVPVAWAVKPLEIAPGDALVVAVKVRCHSEARGPHLVFGVRARGRGGFMVRQGGAAAAWNDLGPFGVDRPGRPMAGFNTNDWHVYTLRVRPGFRDCRVYYDTEPALLFEEPWGEVADDAVVLGTEHPGQEILVDSLWVGPTMPPLEGTFLPALFGVDWELDGAAIEVGALSRHPANPILRPGPADRDALRAYDAWVLREADRYRMWYVGRRSSGPGSPSAIFHAVSDDGVSWRKSPAEPVLEAGEPEEWDGGGLQSPVVLREEGGYTMWYAGYLQGHREARTGIARSDDGLRWRRPRVGAFPFRGSLENNIVYPLQDTIYDDQYAMVQCVLKDEDAPPERRHVMFVHAQGRNCIIEVAYSADGRVFRRDLTNTRYYAVDEFAPEVGRLHQRTTVLHRDGCWWTFFGHVRRQPTGSELRTFFTAWRDATTGGANPSFGAWAAAPQLSPVPGTWEAAQVFPTCLLEDGDEWKLYYTGSPDGARHEVGLATVGRERLWRIGRLPGHTSGRAISRPIGRPAGGWGGYELELNASGLGGAGRLRAALLDPVSSGALPGYSWDDALPLSADDFRAVAGWRATGTRLPDGAGDLSLAFLLEGGARLHAARLRRRGP